MPERPGAQLDPRLPPLGQLFDRSAGIAACTPTPNVSPSPRRSVSSISWPTRRANSRRRRGVVAAPNPVGRFKPLVVDCQIWDGMGQAADVIRPSIFGHCRVVLGMHTRQFGQQMAGEPGKRLQVRRPGFAAVPRSWHPTALPAGAGLAKNIRPKWPRPRHALPPAAKTRPIAVAAPGC